MEYLWEFHGGPVAKTPHSQCRDPEFDPQSGSWIPHASTKHLHAAAKDPACRNEDLAQPNNYFLAECLCHDPALQRGS